MVEGVDSEKEHCVDIVQDVKGVVTPRVPVLFTEIRILFVWGVVCHPGCQELVVVVFLHFEEVRSFNLCEVYIII